MSHHALIYRVPNVVPAGYPTENPLGELYRPKFKLRVHDIVVIPNVGFTYVGHKRKLFTREKELPPIVEVWNGYCGYTTDLPTREFDIAWNTMWFCLTDPLHFLTVLEDAEQDVRQLQRMVYALMKEIRKANVSRNRAKIYYADNLADEYMRDLFRSAYEGVTVNFEKHRNKMYGEDRENLYHQAVLTNPNSLNAISGLIRDFVSDENRASVTNAMREAVVFEDILDKVSWPLD